ncbi:MAG: Trk system potassium transporter TrkA, partial [Opitutaceae bacterium]|nr:Trk system potassium transporter TrkA [Opitutaceae bacterium]
MKIIIIGAGEVGSFLCEILSRRSHDVTLIERSESKTIRMDEEFDVKVIHGNGSSARTLITAGVQKCDHFLAMTSDDETNIVSCSLAKILGAKNTFCRIHDQTFRDNSIINYQSHFGINHLLSPERLASVEIAKRIRNPERVAVEDFSRGTIEVQLVEVQAGSKVVGKPLSELKLNNQMRVGLIQRGEQISVATAETILQPGGHVTIFGSPEKLFEAKSIFDPKSTTSTIQRVVIFGGGETGVSLIRLLSNPRFKIRIIEDDLERSRALAEKFPHITVIHGEGTSLRLFEEEQIGEADFFVASTKDDENNIMTCLQASKLGTKHVILLSNRADYLDVIERFHETLGIEMAVSPRVATANEILRYLSDENFIELATLPFNAGRILEVKVAENSQCVGQTFREISWPKECVIVALLHKFEARTPGANDK